MKTQTENSTKTHVDTIEEQAKTIDALVAQRDQLWAKHDQLIAQRDALRSACEGALFALGECVIGRDKLADLFPKKVEALRSALALCEPKDKEGDRV